MDILIRPIELNVEAVGDGEFEPLGDRLPYNCQPPVPVSTRCIALTWL